MESDKQLNKQFKAAYKGSVAHSSATTELITGVKPNEGPTFNKFASKLSNLAVSNLTKHKIKQSPLISSSLENTVSTGKCSSVILITS